MHRICVFRGFAWLLLIEAIAYVSNLILKGLKVRLEGGYQLCLVEYFDVELQFLA
jgi:hypothetical protein